MKQQFASLLIGASLVGTLCAAPRTQQQAQAIAQQMAASKGHTLVAQSHNPMPDGQALQPYYVFDVQQGGFVIISGEDRMTALVGYSDRGSFDAEHMPDGLRYYLDQYAARVASVSGSTALSSIPTDIDYPTVEPLLGQIQWDQDWPYNLLCPVGTYEIKDENGQIIEVQEQFVTGCAATASAQIMAYYKYPVERVYIPAYTAQPLGIHIDAIEPNGDTFDWANMLPVYTGGESEAEAMAVARLMADVGAGMQMNYNFRHKGGSGTSSLAIYQCFGLMGYDTSLLQLLERRDFTQSHWLEVINNELRHNRPVQYSGVSGDGGHAFVLDGCDGQGYYHINWGWSGHNDGCFDLSVLDPDDKSGAGASQSGDGYHLANSMVIGITPQNVDGEVMVVPDYEGIPDWSKFDVNASLVDPDQNFYFNHKYKYYNPFNIDITNNSNREVNDVLEILALDLSTEEQLPNRELIEFFLQQGETLSTTRDWKTAKEFPAQVAFGFMFSDADEPNQILYPEIVEVEDPELSFTIESNASYRQGDTIDVICSDEVVVNLTIVNTGGHYRGKDFAIAFHQGGMHLDVFEFPTGTTEMTFRLPVEPGYKDYFGIYCDNPDIVATTNYPYNSRWIGSYDFIVADTVTGIEQITSAERPTTNRRYNLQGQPVGADYRGLFIQR